jgi:uncharacterized protein (TIGR00251 family)
LTVSQSPVAEWRGDELLLRIRVQARASRNQVIGVDNNQLRVKTTATPTDGAANKMVSRLLAKYFSVAPSNISLIRGHKHRDKQFLVSGHLVIPAELGAFTDK